MNGTSAARVIMNEKVGMRILEDSGLRHLGSFGHRSAEGNALLTPDASESGSGSAQQFADLETERRISDLEQAAYNAKQRSRQRRSLYAILDSTSEAS